MNLLTLIMVVFSVLGAIDRILGNRFGLAKEFERGFMLFGNLALSMIGMLVLAPLLSDLLAPGFDLFYRFFGMDPSILPALIFANNMGGAALALEVTQNEPLALYNGLVVASMMGFTISFTLPYALSSVNRVHHKDVLLGFLCGICTIPIGCFLSGMMCHISIGVLISDLLPLILFSVLIAIGLIFCPNLSVRIFGWIGIFIKAIITLGIILGIVRFLTGVEIIQGLATFESGAAVCLNAMALMTGVFPLMHTVSTLVSKPLRKLCVAADINEVSSVGFVATLATSITALETMDRMDRKGIVLNAAFSISAGCVFGGHLAYTMTIDPLYAYPVIVGKIVSGLCAVMVAIPIYHQTVAKDRGNKR